MEDNNSSESNELFPANVALLDPRGYGWSCSSGIVNLMTPHERARRSKKRHRSTAFRRESSSRSQNASSSASSRLSAEAFLDHPVSSLLDDDKADKTDKTIKQQHEQAQSNDTNSKNAKDHDNDTPSTLRFAARNSNTNRLNIHSYHRGICGVEEYDVPPTDTNHNCNGVKSFVATIHLNVPLGGGSSSSSSMGDTPTGAGLQQSFRHTITWNFQDAQQQTPMEVAVSLACQFGLNYTETHEVAAQLQKQLSVFCEQHATYRRPTLLQQQQKDARPNALVPQLYGHTTTFGAGFCLPLKTHRSVWSRSSSFRNNNGGKQNVPPSRGSVVYDTPLVLNKLLQASRLDLERKTQGRVVLVAERTMQCHLCPSSLASSSNHQPCVILGCGLPGHQLCVTHLQSMFPHLQGEGGSNTDQWRIDHCPLCSLVCDCVHCQSKLERVAEEWGKRVCGQTSVGVDPAPVEFGDILEFCHRLHRDGNNNNKSTAKKNKRPSIGMAVSHRPKVAKVAKRDFPREVANGVDMDCEFLQDYRKVFTKKGTFVAPPQPPQDDGTVVDTIIEDGSADYCNYCRTAGTLICCDHCPRAFHKTCLPNRGKDIFKDDDDRSSWKCVCCVTEEQGGEQDKIDGSSSISKVRHGFDDVLKDDDLPSLKILCMLHELCESLVQYDFGYMFAAPVEDIPGYAAVVRHPMDLGTVTQRLTDGWYKSHCPDDAFSFDAVILSVLKDIDLVWHNCFLFNREDSAVYRMAQVLQRRANSIRRHSFDDLLSDSVKTAEQESRLERDRELARQKELAPPARKRRAPPSRYKIVGGGANHVSRPVAIFDPDTGEVVKIYCSMQSATNAVAHLLGMKRKCEWKPSELDETKRVRKLVLAGGEDFRVLLFGYRWVFLDDLQRRKVAYDKNLAKGKKKAPPKQASSAKKAPQDLVTAVLEMRDGGVSYFYNSIEESLSAPGLPESIPRIREQLRALRSGGDFVEICGRSWRLLASNGLAVQPVASITLPEPAPKKPTDDVVVIKEDLVSGRRFLAGFSDVEGAFADWKQTVDASIIEYEGPKSMEIFESCYLDGDRNIDGMRWRKRRRSNAQKPSCLENPAKLDGNLEATKPREQNTEDTIMEDAARKPAPEANGGCEGRQIFVDDNEGPSPKEGSGLDGDDTCSPREGPTLTEENEAHENASISAMQGESKIKEGGTNGVHRAFMDTVVVSDEVPQHV